MNLKLEDLAECSQELFDRKYVPLKAAAVELPANMKVRLMQRHVKTMAKGNFTDPSALTVIFQMATPWASSEDSTKFDA